MERSKWGNRTRFYFELAYHVVFGGDRYFFRLENGLELREIEPPGEGRPARPADALPPTVGAVLRGSAAARAGLEVGDVLLSVDERAVLTRDAAREALAEASAGEPLRLTVRRGADRLSLTLSAP